MVTPPPRRPTSETVAPIGATHRSGDSDDPIGSKVVRKTVGGLVRAQVGLADIALCSVLFYMGCGDWKSADMVICYPLNETARKRAVAKYLEVSRIRLADTFAQRVPEPFLLGNRAAVVPGHHCRSEVGFSHRALSSGARRIR